MAKIFSLVTFYKVLKNKLNYNWNTFLFSKAAQVDLSVGYLIQTYVNTKRI